MRNRTTLFLTLGVLALSVGPIALADEGLRITVSFPSSRSRAALDGRMLLLISKDGSKEPRFQINDGPKGQQVFGINVDELVPEALAAFDAIGEMRQTNCIKAADLDNPNAQRHALRRRGETPLHRSEVAHVDVAVCVGVKAVARSA